MRRALSVMGREPLQRRGSDLWRPRYSADYDTYARNLVRGWYKPVLVSLKRARVVTAQGIPFHCNVPQLTSWAVENRYDKQRASQSPSIRRIDRGRPKARMGRPEPNDKIGPPIAKQGATLCHKPIQQRASISRERGRPVRSTQSPATRWSHP